MNRDDIRDWAFAVLLWSLGMMALVVVGFVLARWIMAVL